MPRGPKGEKRPAAMVAKVATGEIEEQYDTPPAKDEAAVALGRRGGKARAERMSPEQRREIAQKAAKARWQASPVPSEKE